MLLYVFAKTIEPLQSTYIWRPAIKKTLGFIWKLNIFDEKLLLDFQLFSFIYLFIWHENATGHASSFVVLDICWKTKLGFDPNWRMYLLGLLTGKQYSKGNTKNNLQEGTNMVILSIGRGMVSHLSGWEIDSARRTSIWVWENFLCNLWHADMRGLYW